MRSRQEIINDHRPYEVLNLEVFLDIRDALTKQNKVTVPEQIKKPAVRKKRTHVTK